MHVRTCELMQTVPSSFSLNKTWITLPMRDAAGDLAGAFFGDPVSVHIQRHRCSAATVGGWGVEWWWRWWGVSAYLRVFYCDVLTSCLGPVMYLSCGLSGASTASPLSFLNQSGRQNLKQLPASSFFPFLFQTKEELETWKRLIKVAASKGPEN